MSDNKKINMLLAQADTNQVPESGTKTLTVIVVDSQSKLAPGAKVTLEPSGASGVTDSSGQVQFRLGEAKKYDVKVSLGKDTVVVPYYVTSSNASRLMVNPSYVKEVELSLDKGQSGQFFSSWFGITASSIFILILIFILWVLFKRYTNRKRAQRRNI